MSDDEFMAIATAIKGLYPKAGILDTDIQLSIWARVARDIPAGVGEQFVVDWAMTSKFPPTLADFNKYAVDKLLPPMKDAMEAWGDVLKAVSRFGYDRQREALDSLDEISASVVGSMGWYSICMSEIDDLPTLRAQFRNAYEARAKVAERKRTETGIKDYLEAQRQEAIERRDE